MTDDRQTENEAHRNTGGATGLADHICERADRCDKLNSDGERCRHGYPHPWDSGCEMGCRAKLPFGAVCRPLPNNMLTVSGGLEETKEDRP